jgi:acetylornithine aminotransferase/acetylornithine/N-succinyldiaminopimelate aminotransferase
MMPGFRHVPYNDLAAVRAAISPATIAILIEGIQGEGGLTMASPEFLIGLRKLCDEKRMLLLMDGVQDGYFRTGRFQSFQRILESGSRGNEAPSGKSDINQSLLTSAATGFVPDGISMAKSLGGGFPIGAFWAREPHGDLLGPGTHASTFGGTPLGCAVALKILEVVREEKLQDNVRTVSEFLKNGLQALAKKYPRVIHETRGIGLMIGIELAENIPNLPGDTTKTQAIRFVNLLHAAGLLTIPAGANVIRLLPALNLRQTEAEEGLKIIEAVAAKFAG